MKAIPRLHRHHEIRRVRADLEREGFPRLQMFLLVTLTGASGFIASYLFLSAGFEQMWLRYFASVGVAYGMFLVLLWIWLRSRAEDYSDVPIASESSPYGAHGSSETYSSKGGEFGGGGASGSFDGSPESISALGDAGGSGGSVGEVIGSAAAAEEFAIPLVVLVFIVAMVFSSLFLVYSAPVLFAELLVDGVLSASLYRRLRGLETRHWLETAVRRTAWPFAITALIVAASGWGMALYAPGAHSIGEVVAHAKKGSSL